MSCDSPSATSCRRTCGCCDADGLECDEAVLTGESLPAEKRSDPVTAHESSLDLAVVRVHGDRGARRQRAGRRGGTGGRTEFGAIAHAARRTQPQTAFQLGLRDFSLLLVQVTVVLAVSIFVINVVLGHSLLESVLFALAIAVGLTPQLLPAIVTISLSTGAERLAERTVVVKRLVSIEDLGDVDVLFTDKTGTLTEGTSHSRGCGCRRRSSRSGAARGAAVQRRDPLRRAVVGGNPLDQTLWDAPGAHSSGVDSARRLAALPFDYQRRLASVLIEQDGGRQVIVKGAPETVLARCTERRLRRRRRHARRPGRRRQPRRSPSRRAVGDRPRPR